MSRVEPRRVAALIALAVLGMLALSERWLRGRRPTPSELRKGQRIVVFTSKDSGPGSLREAIFSADRAEGPAVIALQVRQITVTSPLPPLVNPKGVVIDANPFGCELDARTLPGGPALELKSPNSLVERLAIRGAAGMGLLVSAPGARLRGITISDCAEGVTLTDGASETVVEQSRFENNGVGVKIAPEARRVTLRKNRFAHHDQAAVWAVAPKPGASARAATLLVKDNQFEDDRISVVLIHTRGRVEHNEFRRAREVAVHLTGSGMVVRENRTWDGAGSGIVADQTEGALIEGNELDHNATVGILLRSGEGNVVRKNRIYGNAYGIAVVFGEKRHPNLVASNLLLAQLQDALYVVGGSPLIRENRAVNNRAAGLRVLDFIPRNGPRVVAEPLLKDNVLEGNHFDGCVRGVYSATPVERRASR